MGAVQPELLLTDIDWGKNPPWVNQVEHPETRKDIVKTADNKSPTANQTTHNEVQSTQNSKHVTSGFVFYSAK